MKKSEDHLHHERLNSALGQSLEDFHRATPMNSVLGGNREDLREDQLHEALLNPVQQENRKKICSTKRW